MTAIGQAQHKAHCYQCPARKRQLSGILSLHNKSSDRGFLEQSFRSESWVYKNLENSLIKNYPYLHLQGSKAPSSSHNSSASHLHRRVTRTFLPAIIKLPSGTTVCNSTQLSRTESLPCSSAAPSTAGWLECSVSTASLRN